MAYDVGVVRRQYPALADGRAWLDGAAGTQVPQVVADAVADAYRSGVSNQGAVFAASARADEVVAEARRAVADLVGAPDPRGVVLGPTMTALTYRFAAALCPTWRPGDEVLLTQLDHDANVRPWAQAAQRVGATVRVAEVNRATGELPVQAVTRWLTGRTRVVALPAASNLIGTVPDVAAITAEVRRAGALSYVDGVHHAPHAHVDLPALGADLYATSSYKWAGPHVAAVVAADPATLEPFHPEQLTPAPGTVPERFELGTAPFAPLAGLAAAVDHLAGLDPAATGDRRSRLAISRTAAAAHESWLGTRMLAGLAVLPGVTVYGAPARRTPTVAFRVAGHSPAAVAGHLDRRGVNCWHGYAYAHELAGALGVREDGGVVRASVNHYNDHADVEALLAAIAELAGTR